MIFDEEYWKNEIINCCSVIDETLKSFPTLNRDVISSNVISHLRDLVEATASYHYVHNLNHNQIESLLNRYDDIIVPSLAYIKQRHHTQFLSFFHDELKRTSSHYTISGEYAERLMIKYLERMIEVKKHLQNYLSINVLNNIGMFPLNLDESTKDYYRKILIALGKVVDFDGFASLTKDCYYIQKKKMIFIDNEIFYEYTLTSGIDNVSKFDRFITFSKLNILRNYAIVADIFKEEIDLFGKKYDVSIISNYEISIRPCEFEKLAKILGLKDTKITRTNQYNKLMDYIKSSHKNLTQILDCSTSDYKSFIQVIGGNKLDTFLIDILEKARDFIINKKNGSNIIRYLLCIMNNTILNEQIEADGCSELSGLYIKSIDKHFDKMPYCTSLSNHNPTLASLLECIDVTDKEEQLFARTIVHDSDENSIIYHKLDKSIDKTVVDDYINRYNSQLEPYHSDRRLERFGDYVFINANEKNTYLIITLLLDKTKTPSFVDYSSFIEQRINTINLLFDDNEKENAVKNMFSKTDVFCIYGAAGTGKSTLISKELAAIGPGVSKLCLAATHPALENMKRKIMMEDAHYYTISSFIKSTSLNTEWNILIIDECSTVSSLDMYKLLQKVQARLIILSGDVYQIKPIRFGSWFNLLRYFIPSYAYIDLSQTFRSGDQHLKDFWNEVRTMGNYVQEMLTNLRISKRLDQSIFEKPRYQDNIVLCLNYDGLYGINNVNKILQLNNPNKPFVWKHYVFKVDDPIIFSESYRFNNYLYNNLKGRIIGVDIDKYSNIIFKLEVYTNLNPLINYSFYGFKYLGKNGDNSVIELKVISSKRSDYDNDSRDYFRVPFQISYAISIHKAQGLEYDSVRIIITDEIDEMITHNIFYTAITRAKKELTIFWPPEVENSVIKGLTLLNSVNDANILVARKGIKRLK